MINEENKKNNGSAQGNFGHGPIQLRLWEIPDLDPTKRLKTAMKEALLACGMSREKVVSDMNALGIVSGLCQETENGKITLTIL